VRDEDKTKEQLVNELVELRGRFAELETAEANGKQTEERYRHLYEQSPIGIGLASPDGRVVSGNKAMETIIGYSIEELREINIADLYENLEDRKALIEDVNRYGGVVNFPVRLKRKHGTPIDCLLTISQFHGLGGEDLLQTICIDITERKRAEEALRQSEDRFRSLVETTSDWIWEVNRNGVYTYASPKVKELLGYEPEEVIGKTPFDLMPPEEAKPIEQEFRAIVKSQRPFKILENVTLHKQGRSVILETSGIPIFDLSGQLCGYRGIDRDITKRKRADQALLERERELEIKTSSLEEVNTALRVLLKRREEDKTELEEKVLFNVRELVGPYVEKLKRSGLDKRQKACVDILESNLNDIISPFSRRLSSMHLNLTPTEIEVANLVRNGKTTKDIAEFLNVSSQAIDFHRKNIRRKIGINNKKANLRSHLLSIQ
jgi:PAS domain S-box-containing protein